MVACYKNCMSEKKDAIFKTTTKREVWISRLTFKATYEGCLEGTAETNSFYMREDNGFAEDLKRAFPELQSFFVVDNGEPELPRFKWMALLKSEAISSKDFDCMSRLGLCWFTDTFDCDLPSILEKIISEIEWEEVAEEFEEII